MHHHEVGHDHNAGDRRDVADEIEIELVIECRVERVRRCGQEERIAIRCRTHDDLCGDITRGTRPVLDDEWLAEPPRQPLTDQASDDVGATAGGKSDNDAHRPRSASCERTVGSARAFTAAALSLAMMSFGVPLGAQSALQLDMYNPGT